MSERVQAAIAELAAALLAELRAELAEDRGVQDGPPALLSIEVARRRLGGIGRSALYDVIGRGELRSVKVGRRRLIPADALAELAQRGTAPHANGAAQEVRSHAARPPG